MSASIFVTDGVCGTPGEYPLDEQTVARLGAATAHILNSEHPRLLVARDTRESWPWIERHLAAGVAAEHGSLVSVGVMPTPPAAFLSALPESDAGFVISASHNSCPDNGIKVLTGDGMKASIDLESRLSDVIGDVSWRPLIDPIDTLETRDMTEAYVAHIQTVLRGTDTFAPSRIAVDCANGAMSVVAPSVLRGLGFDVVALNVEPDGHNSNDGCGSTHPEGLCRTVRDRECRLGVPFDGDGDRAILVDHMGGVVDGDAVLFICVTHLASRGKLPGNAVVATVMSNHGLEVALRNAGIVVHRCPVGDRQVFEEMHRWGAVLGGEQSGYIIFSEFLGTGDGLLTTLSVLRVMRETGRELADLRSGLEIYPQVLVNVPVRTKPALETEPGIPEAIRNAESTLCPDGRVLVRYSGTEPILRGMIEGCDRATVDGLAETIAQHARTRLGER